MTWRLTSDVSLLGTDFPLPLREPFTLAQALRVGITHHHVRALQSRCLIRRVLKGVYVAAQEPDGIQLRARALSLVVPPAAVVTDWTACWLWTGVTSVNDHLEVPPVSMFHWNRHSRLRNEVSRSGSRTFRPSDVTMLDGLRLTTPLRTACDLGRLAHRDLAIGALDALLRHGSFTDAELAATVERFTGMRGVVQLRALAPQADPRAESPGESTLRLRWLDMPSLPPPTPQVPVLRGDVEVYRIDLGVPELRYGCEYDGQEHHSAEADIAHDDRRRDDLGQCFGWDVEGVTKANVYGATRDIEEILHLGIERARRAAGLRPSYEW
jgi:hypothetical protein